MPLHAPRGYGPVSMTRVNVSPSLSASLVARYVCASTISGLRADFKKAVNVLDAVYARALNWTSGVGLDPGSVCGCEQLRTGLVGDRTASH